MNPADPPVTQTVSLFPLPSSVFYPGTVLPLHIFEPRYRRMVGDSLDSGQWIGMVLLAEGWEQDYYGSPETLPVGCAGRIDQWVKHDDGKYDIVLRGQSRFRILREVGDAPYRQAEVELLREINDRNLSENPHARLIQLFNEYTRILPDQNAQKVELDIHDCRTLSEVVDRVAYFFDQPLSEKQTFLEECDVMKRLNRIQELIELKQRIAHQSSMFSRKGFESRLN
ncbi:MAG: hypothetical protein GWM98_04010 [Nitrospinaceae bacterium]|nr:LON peptidase substrate-binding domain-containing protein [Nitrospinaceae bacterium]NIR53822.1 LON peptidase substrate-binding domain-containing protein [Nitrospinaceae bacterium]NIS84233.1 LON peptidase substrate-binding domain-containing protein [Nitrospinaceae bacterium]NIT81037.1 LON peptidase substrate-binding domain-containing protein [Nitrospinaceae bacterium]NIU43328.1 LON peptidase substrate-binding domain-containing protein [Nitrospinaceae bacterium]